MMSIAVRRGGGWWLAPLLSLAAFAAGGGDQRLVDAVQHRQKAAVQALLMQKVDVNTPQPDGATALAWAAHWDDLETADLLIRAGANANAANDYGVTPLSLACTNRSAAMVEKLLKAGADPNAALLSGETPLMTCSRTGGAELVQALLTHGANVNAKDRHRGQTALMWALEEKHIEVARALIEHGADVNARSNGGFTPLLFAARQGDLESAKMLLAAGADVNAATPLRSSPPGRRAKYAASGAESGTTGQQAGIAATNSAVRTGAFTFEGTPDGLTPLLMASASGHEALSLYLLENGANPNAADSNGATALHYALMKGMALITAVPTHLAVDAYVFRPNMLELIRALLARGANPNARMVQDPRLPGSTPRFSLIGATPFFVATATGDLSLMRFLVSKGADPLLATTNNTTALMVAAGLGNFEDRTTEEKKSALEAAKMLLEWGADVNAVGENGWTALHGAAYTGEDAIAQFLVENGARMDVKDVFEQTPLSIARGEIGAKVLDFTKKPFGPHPSTANLLLRLGATPSSAAVSQRTDGSGTK